jgi:PAS domain-containing protein
VLGGGVQGYSGCVAVEQQPIELIQTRGLISNLTTPAFLVDVAGALVFFNDAAGELLGLRYEEAGPMKPSEWGTRFEPLRLDGTPYPVDELPLARALSERLPAHERMLIRPLVGGEREIEVSAFPITGPAGTHGALAIFWVIEPD